MPGMLLLHAFPLLLAVIILVATPWRGLHPFLAVTAVAVGFGVTAGFSVAFVGKTFGSGFSQNVVSPGLVIVAAGFVAALADATGASAWLVGQPQRSYAPGPSWLAALWGLVAGIAASPATAFALVTPLLRTATAGTTPRRDTVPMTLALAISASHGLVLFSPVPIAAASILDAAWGRVVLFGLPLAVVLAVVGALWARALSATMEPQSATLLAPPAPAAVAKPNGWSAAVLLLAIVVPLLLLMVQSLGDIPSEPLGGGMARERIIGLGRPLTLLVAGIGIMVIGNIRRSEALLTDSAWTSRILATVAGPLLAVGAAGGLQRLCQETGMAELLGERVAGWHLAGPAALLIPFLVAATVKTLQGSSLVAAITTAGIVQPLLIPLGLGGDNAKALAALAIGAGAMTVSHVNDEFFWLVSVTTGARPARTLGVFSLGTLVQGVIAIAVLLIVGALVGSS
jgi:gluconate:H+ symporter, GntP family